MTKGIIWNKYSRLESLSSFDWAI